MSGKLYIVATPIGNLGDMTERAVKILRGCDIIAAEDTQNSVNLLNKFDIRAKKLASNHKFNERGACDYFLRELLGGKSIAVISDAGTPCISDPGGELVRRAVENNIAVEGIPGACAAVAAVSVSGFDAGAFSFAGFFPRQAEAARKAISEMGRRGGVHIFYESPKRIMKTLEIFAAGLPGAQVCLCNDLTKKFERVYRGTPSGILAELRENPSAEKGEYTVVINADAADVPDTTGAPPISTEAILVDVMLRQNCTLKAAVKIAAAEYCLNKNDVYAASLNLKNLLNLPPNP